MTVDQALIYLGYEVTDAQDPVVFANVSRLLSAAEATLRGAVGDDVFELMPTDPRVDELICEYMDDLHSMGGIVSKVSSAVRHMTNTMELQLRLELGRLREHPPDGGDY